MAPWVWPVAAAALVRIPLAFVAQDQWGDAPIRLDLVEHWMAAPGLWWSFKRVFQYGPLPTHLAGLLGNTGVGADVACRSLVLVAGIVSCGLLAALAARAGGPRAGLAAGLALAVSPLHIQGSTTFQSEAIYLAFALGCVWAAGSLRPWACAAFAFCAATTRYDAWLWLPILGAFWVTRREMPVRRRFLAAALLAAGPLSILLANAVDLGDPLASVAYIRGEHVRLVGLSQAEYGVWPWRLAMAGYWPVMLIAVLTPAFGIAIVLGAARALRWRTTAALPVLLGGIVPAVYFVQTVALGSLWPMSRLCLVPIALAAVAMPPLKRRTLLWCVVLGVACDVAVAVVGDGQPGIGQRAAAVSPVSRLPADLVAGGKALKAVDGPVALDFVPTYEDVLVAYAARPLYRYTLLHPLAGTIPRRIVAIEGGAFDAELRASFDKLRMSGQAFGHRYRRSGGQGRVSWWDLEEPSPARPSWAPWQTPAKPLP